MPSSMGLRGTSMKLGKPHQHMKVPTNVWMAKDHLVRKWCYICRVQRIVLHGYSPVSCWLPCHNLRPPQASQYNLWMLVGLRSSPSGATCCTCQLLHRHVPEFNLRTVRSKWVSNVKLGEIRRGQGQDRGVLSTLIIIERDHPASRGANRISESQKPYTSSTKLSSVLDYLEQCTCMLMSWVLRLAWRGFIAGGPKQAYCKMRCTTYIIGASRDVADSLLGAKRGCVHGGGEEIT